MKANNEITTLATHLENIAKAANMVEIHAVLLSITGNYLNRYANEVRMFDKKIEKQGDWIHAAINHFRTEIMSDKTVVFDAIPERFKNTGLYLQLKREFNTIIDIPLKF